MEQFSLEKYLENPNRKVVTRGGRAVRIVCTNRKFKYLNVQYPVMALIKGFDDDNEYTFNIKQLFRNQVEYFLRAMRINIVKNLI